MQRLEKCPSRSRERPCTEDHDTVEAHYPGFKRTHACALREGSFAAWAFLTLTPRCVFLSAFRRIALMRVIFECVSENSLPIHHKFIANSSA